MTFEGTLEVDDSLCGEGAAAQCPQDPIRLDVENALKLDNRNHGARIDAKIDQLFAQTPVHDLIEPWSLDVFLFIDGSGFGIGYDSVSPSPWICSFADAVTGSAPVIRGIIGIGAFALDEIVDDVRHESPLVLQEAVQ